MIKDKNLKSLNKELDNIKAWKIYDNRIYWTIVLIDDVGEVFYMGYDGNAINYCTIDKCLLLPKQQADQVCGGALNHNLRAKCVSYEAAVEYEISRLEEHVTH